MTARRLLSQSWASVRANPKGVAPVGFAFWVYVVLCVAGFGLAQRAGSLPLWALAGVVTLVGGAALGCFSVSRAWSASARRPAALGPLLPHGLWLAFLNVVVIGVLLINAHYSFAGQALWYRVMGLFWVAAALVWLVAGLTHLPLLVEHYCGYLRDEKAHRGGRRLLYQGLLLTLESFPFSLRSAGAVAGLTVACALVPVAGWLVWPAMVADFAVRHTRALLQTHVMIETVETELIGSAER